MAYANGYTYKRAVTLDGAQIAGGLSDFPVLVTATLDPAKVHAAGYDIRFETTAGVQLDHQIESYSAGALTAWVRLPGLTAATDTTIDLFYGNASVTTGSEANPAGVWSAFVGVWLLNESAGGSAAFKDWTSHGNHMSSVGSQLTYGVPGKITTALSRNGSTAELSRAVTDGNTAIPAGPLTVMMWSKSNADAQNGNAQAVWEETSGRFRYFTTGGQGRQWRVYKTSGTLAGLTGITADQNWHHLTLRVGTDGASAYQDAGLVNTNATVNSYIGTNNKIGVLSSGTANQGMNGAVSHLMVATADLGEAWISTAYANQNAPATFAVVGSEESGSTGPEEHTGTGVALAATVALSTGVGVVRQVAYWSDPVTVTVGGTSEAHTGTGAPLTGFINSDDATGRKDAVGTGPALAATASLATGTGTHAEQATGTGAALTAAATTAAGVGTKTATGTGAASTATVGLTATGVRASSGTGTGLTATAALAPGVGFREGGTEQHAGTGQPLTATITTSATGTKQATGQGSTPATAALEDGTGTKAGTGTGTGASATVALAVGTGSREGGVDNRVGSGAPLTATAGIGAGVGVKAGTSTGQPLAATATIHGGTGTKATTGSGSLSVTITLPDALGTKATSGTGLPQTGTVVLSGVGSKASTGSGEELAAFAAFAVGAGFDTSAYRPVLHPRATIRDNAASAVLAGNHASATIAPNLAGGTIRDNQAAATLAPNNTKAALT